MQLATQEKARARINHFPTRPKTVVVIY